GVSPGSGEDFPRAGGAATELRLGLDDQRGAAVSHGGALGRSLSRPRDVRHRHGVQPSRRRAPRRVGPAPPASPGTMSSSAAGSEPVLRVEGLSTEFATPAGSGRAVDGVSFEIPPGAAVGLVGESGSGKSTVALSILRLLGPGGRITGGRILFRGEDLLAKPPDELQKLRGNRLATVFQDPLTT